jgi:PhzF family phenazine biosynthesis protein
MSLPLFQVDAFTDQLFAGNPAAVCLLDKKREDHWMQQLAAEMNLSETAFLLKQSDDYSLRWFTPRVEVELCGHATLASAHVLFEMGLIASGEEAHFHTLSGLLTARKTGDWIELNFPTQPPKAIEPPEAIIKAVGIHPGYCGKSNGKYLFEVANEEIIRNLQPEFAVIKNLTKEDIIVTSVASTPGFDFVSRFFAPSIGIDEDPVTGSAHCVLAPYWQGRLGKTEFKAYQASARGGVLRVRLAGDRTFISGQAVTVFKTELSD